MTPTTKTYEDLLDAVEQNQVTVKAGQAGQTLLEGDGVEMMVLSPSRTDYTDLNDYSIVTKLTVGETSFLFQGDAEAGVEEEILDSGADVACDVIKLGHHGSSTSSSRAYLEAASPSAAVISCGVDNDYGHPHEETLESLEDLGIPPTARIPRKPSWPRPMGNRLPGPPACIPSWMRPRNPAGREVENRL